MPRRSRTAVVPTLSPMPMSVTPQDTRAATVSGAAPAASGWSATETAAPRRETAAPRGGKLRAWVISHDDSKLFLAAYIGLAVVLSIWISLFWLVAVVAVHLVFELIRQFHRQPHPVRAVLESLWELKLDFALVLFALVLSLYMTVVLGVVGLQGAARLGAASRAAARFGAWERTLRGVVLSADDAAQVARAVSARRRVAAPGADAKEAASTAAQLRLAGPPGWAWPWSTGAWIAIGLGVVCVILLFAAPLLTEHTSATALATLAKELTPFP